MGRSSQTEMIFALFLYEEQWIHNQIKSLMESYSDKAQAYMTTRLDRLRLVECFREPEIKEAYPKTQDVMI